MATIVARQKTYTDLDFAFRRIPNTNDVALKTDVEAVKQSVINILSTNRGERPFLPSFGGNIRSYLFENFSPVMAVELEEEIISALANHEPRVKVLSVDISDMSYRNALQIRLELEILSPVQTQTSVEFIVERLR
jgi:uncharacterized protein